MINVHEYGRALFELADEQGAAEEIYAELMTVADILCDHPDYVTLLDTPAIPTGEKPILVDRAFASCHVYVRDFIKILSAKRAIGQFSSCVRVFGECLDDSRGILRAVAKTAVPMTEAQIGRLSQKLSAMTGKTAILTNECDPAVIGGVTLMCDGSRFDGSIRARLEELRTRLSEATIG